MKSGNPEHPEDRLYNATFQIKTINKIAAHKLPPDCVQTSDGFYIINKFSNDLGTVSGYLNTDIVGAISQIRVHIPAASETWIILSEIDFSTKLLKKKV